LVEHPAIGGRRGHPDKSGSSARKKMFQKLM